MIALIARRKKTGSRMATRDVCEWVVISNLEISEALPERVLRAWHKVYTNLKFQTYGGTLLIRRLSTELVNNAPQCVSFLQYKLY